MNWIRSSYKLSGGFNCRDFGRVSEADTAEFSKATTRDRTTSSSLMIVMGCLGNRRSSRQSAGDYVALKLSSTVNTQRSNTHSHIEMDTLINAACELKRNSSDKQYRCEEEDCGRMFRSKRGYLDHTRSHKGRPHVCDVHGCGKAFLRPAHLEMHSRIHTGEKPFVCEYKGCGKRWNQKSALKQHLRSHTGEKPFSCSYCSKRFSTTSSCKRHFLTHERSSVEITPFRLSSPNSSEVDLPQASPTSSPPHPGFSSIMLPFHLLEDNSSNIDATTSTNASPRMEEPRRKLSLDFLLN
ncbi:transcriptional activator GLI3-like [Planoprotostelium fungivorum]|uniref:Transcriptional activator GLI3-like n=1 Tax=Planoprotostelium fungivorum TaxID=1890364 RepID=A0A2P6N5V6_9EUKA|nr:transcriptional activator GLI3-like [Planoprotostelium fungivorum]